MAGQPPPEPSFQPSGPDQGQGMTQARPVWQQPSYPPPPPPGSGAVPAGGQQAYAAPAYGQQEQAYSAQDQPSQDYQNYPGYQGYQGPGYGAQPAQDPGYAAQAGQGQGQDAGAQSWAGAAGAEPRARTKQPGEKGFLGSLFDFSFSSFVTPKIIRMLYILFTVWTALVAVVILIIGFRTGGVVGGLFTLIIVEPIFVLLTLGIYRVILEAFMVVFRIYEETRQIRESAQNRT